MLSNRKQPQNPPPEVKVKKTGLVRQVRTYRLITPLYGGGAKPQQPDEVTVVRASEIRGLLRFWWRATRGGQFGGSLEKMRAAEEAIWGSATGKGKGTSPISLAVRIINRGHEIRQVIVRTRHGEKRVNIGDPSSPYGYVAFPLRDNKGSVWGGVEFELHITLRTASVKVDDREFNLQEEIEAALWAWETFGGVGARTRRGFGALELVAWKENGHARPVEKPQAQDVLIWLKKKLTEHVVGAVWAPGVPHLSHNPLMALTNSQSDGIKAWQILIQRLQTFRQRRHKKYGLSLWPEANVIRKVNGLAPKWPPNVSNPRLVEKFPRAHFGLPVVFHMPHDKQLKDDFTLRGQSAPGSDKPIDRLASPLILRPLACRDGKYVGLAIVLDTPREPPYGLEVDGFPPNKKNVRADLTKREANTEPLRHVLNGEPDVLKAFMRTLGWKEE